MPPIAGSKVRRQPELHTKSSPAKTGLSAGCVLGEESRESVEVRAGRRYLQ